MRTTVTLEPDLAAKLKDYAHRKRTTFKEALNTLLRRGLASQSSKPPAGRRFVLEPHSGRFQPGVDPGRLNQLVDQLETRDFGRSGRSGR